MKKRKAHSFIPTDGIIVAASEMPLFGRGNASEVPAGTIASIVMIQARSFIARRELTPTLPA